MKRLFLTVCISSALAGLPCIAKNANGNNKNTPTPTATAILTLDDGINTKIIDLDNAAWDAQPATGLMQVVTNVGVWTIVVTPETKPALGTALAPAMDVNFMLTSTGPGKLTVTFSDSGFGSGPETGVLEATMTGLLVYGDAMVDWSVWGDPGNVVSAQTVLIADPGPQTWPPYVVADTGSIDMTGPFSLTESFVVTTTQASHLNVDASFVLPFDTGNKIGCRVTGGSNHETNNYQSLCITTPVPDFVSHGGQVGAANSLDTPWDPASLCISGEWEHNRHLIGAGLVGAFHASGNTTTHQYDSLLCACLPCPENPSAPGVIGDLCNPGDKICGPQPMHAPANKICFSGVGEFTFTSGPKTVNAVFRVDIEDRGEGNSQANPLPPDRYRIRIWLLDPSCGRSSDPNAPANVAIRYGASADPNQIGNLATTENLKDPTIGPPDIDDGGDMTQGNHQIHFSTGSKCP